MSGVITIGEQIEHLEASEKILIREESGEVLYQGFCGCLQFTEMDYSREVRKIRLEVRVVRRKKQENWQDRIIPRKIPKEEIPQEELQKYRFSDLEFDIRLCITLNKMEKKEDCHC